MAAGAQALARPSGNSGISTTTTPAPASTGGARQARTISSCASANGRRRIRCGFGSISPPPCASARGYRRPPKRAARSCWRSRWPSFSTRGGERVGVLGSVPYTGRNASRRVAEVLVGDAARRPACRPARAQANSPSASCSAISSSRWRRPPRAIEAIAAQGVRGHLVQILDPAEETLPYEGRTEFAASEGRDRVIAGRAETLRERYQERLTSHRNALVAETKRLNWSFLVHHTDRPAEEVVLAIHNRLAGLERDYRFRPTAPSRPERPARGRIMMTLGAIGFLQPWILLGLAALPAIWWLLRLTPPSPQHVVFPPTRLLKDLKSTEETPAHSPWWLTALRMLLAALIVLALARPVLNPDRRELRRQRPASARRRQWLGVRLSLARAARGDRRRHRPRHARRPDRGAGAVSPWRSAHRTGLRRAGARARRGTCSPPLRA